MLRTFKTFLYIIIAIAFADFAVVNRATVHVSLYPLPYSADMPQFLLTLLCFALGAITGGIVVNIKLVKAMRLFKSEHKRLMALENEVQVTRSKPSESLSVRAIADGA